MWIVTIVSVSVPPVLALHSCGESGMKIYSELFPIKYLFSDKGICFGLDTKRCSYLFLLSKKGVIFSKRPVGDKVVENLGYEIDLIENAIKINGKIDGKREESRMP